ncbi:MAG: 16S rRNA (adenine(1518)-N(6)/adenine(1519)-N(6))-dimethyltransferase RsmA [Actinomycetota bacterium]|nr:16S rRNA (adenine(1518)-N(6)/adenine(1519)-N(6))-dimethyltransferase RsmA [Actinomycetota bacterium]
MGELAKPSVVAEILERHGIRLTRSLGQHFLIDGNVLRRLVTAADLKPSDTVLEIGPGIGTLTEELCDCAGRVVAVETDSRLATVLRDILGDRDNLELVEGDALRVDLTAFFSEEEPVKLVSNLPYNISTPLILHVLREMPQVITMTVTVQRELADRYMASPGKSAYGGVSVKIRILAEVEWETHVPPTVFLPQPRVQSSIIRIQRRDSPVSRPEMDGFFHFLNAAFAKRRKMLVNSLGGGRTPYCPRGRVEEALRVTGSPLSCRAEELTGEQLLEIFRRLAAL